MLNWQCIKQKQKTEHKNRFPPCRCFCSSKNLLDPKRNSENITSGPSHIETQTRKNFLVFGGQAVGWHGATAWILTPCGTNVARQTSLDKRRPTCESRQGWWERNLLNRQISKILLDLEVEDWGLHVILLESWNHGSSKMLISTSSPFKRTVFQLPGIWTCKPTKCQYSRSVIPPQSGSFHVKKCISAFEMLLGRFTSNRTTWKTYCWWKKSWTS